MGESQNVRPQSSIWSTMSGIYEYSITSWPILKVYQILMTRQGTEQVEFSQCVFHDEVWLVSWRFVSNFRPLHSPLSDPAFHTQTSVDFCLIFNFSLVVWALLHVCSIVTDVHQYNSSAGALRRYSSFAKLLVERTYWYPIEDSSWGV
jgi:hypothetical protein